MMAIDVFTVTIMVVAIADSMAQNDTPHEKVVLLVLFLLSQVHSTHLFVLLIIPYMRTSMVSMTRSIGGLDKNGVLIFS